LSFFGQVFMEGLRLGQDDAMISFVVVTRVRSLPAQSHQERTFASQNVYLYQLGMGAVLEALAVDKGEVSSRGSRAPG
jgi:hypothetical protein